jgi:hypothetical protein
MIIHSFDNILRMPRQMHSFEILPGRRIALPRSVPWISAVYFAVIELALVLASHVISFVAALSSVIGIVVDGNLKPAGFLISYVLIPAGLTWISMNVEIDGRAPHRWIVSACATSSVPSASISAERCARRGLRRPTAARCACGGTRRRRGCSTAG